jgi:hypothetical protein
MPSVLSTNAEAGPERETAINPDDVRTVDASWNIAVAHGGFSPISAVRIMTTCPQLAKADAASFTTERNVLGCAICCVAAV